MNTRKNIFSKLLFHIPNLRTHSISNLYPIKSIIIYQVSCLTSVFIGAAHKIHLEHELLTFYASSISFNEELLIFRYLPSLKIFRIYQTDSFACVLTHNSFICAFLFLFSFFAQFTKPKS